MRETATKEFINLELETKEPEAQLGNTGLTPFEFFTNYTKMPFLSLLHENKKSSEKMLPPVGIEPRPLITSDSKCNTILSGLTWHFFVRLRL